MDAATPTDPTTQSSGFACGGCNETLNLLEIKKTPPSSRPTGYLYPKQTGVHHDTPAGFTTQSDQHSGNRSLVDRFDGAIDGLVELVVALLCAQAFGEGAAEAAPSPKA